MWVDAGSDRTRWKVGFDVKLSQNTNAIPVAAENAASNVTPYRGRIYGGSYARGSYILVYGDDDV